MPIRKKQQERYSPKAKNPYDNWRDGRSKKHKMKPGRIIKTGERPIHR